ncbi:MAG TPA: DegT/DnrJ/EryC1/StrS family aminotransferase, partial [Bacillota bacterium]|nr:DegT/DnrJ/EryC1/StrS family aminotransferase [Bacillota bacterium]
HLDGLGFMPINKWNEPNIWLTCITLDGQIKPTDIIVALEKDNIETRPIWKPMHLQPVFEGYDFIGQGVSEEIFESGLCLPSDTKMTDKDLDRVCKAIMNIWKT